MDSNYMKIYFDRWGYSGFSIRDTLLYSQGAKVEKETSSVRTQQLSSNLNPFFVLFDQFSVLEIEINVYYPCKQFLWANKSIN